jgi:hypothetical protein
VAIVGPLTPSITAFHVPTPDPVVTSRVADVFDIAVNVPAVTAVVPLRLLAMITEEPLVQLVAVPKSVIVCGVLISETT